MQYNKKHYTNILKILIHMIYLFKLILLHQHNHVKIYNNNLKNHG